MPRPWQSVRPIAVVISWLYPFLNFCCPNFKLLLRFFTIVTISHFEMLYFEPFCPNFKLLLRFFTIVTISRFEMLYFEPFCLNFKLLLWFFTIVTISCFEMLYFEPFGLFYHDFILLTCILRQPVRLVGLVILFSFRSRIFAVGGDCD